MDAEMKPDVDKTTRAGAWSAVDLLTRNGLQFVIGIVMARLLLPTEFGVAALATIFAGIAAVTTQSGLVIAIVQNRNMTRETESALFWSHLVLAAAIAIGVAGLSGPAALFFEQPQLRLLLPLVSLAIVLSAPCAIQNAIMTRELRYRHLAFAGLITMVCSGTVGIALAASGFGAHSIVLMLIANAATQTTVLWWLGKWRPLFRFRIAGASIAHRSSAWIAGAGLIDVIYNQGTAPLIGKLYGVREVGLFNRGVGTQQMLTATLSGMIARIALPVFSAYQEDDAALQRGMRTANALAMAVMVPAMIGLSLTADLVIRVLYGSNWLAAAPILAIISFAGILYPVSFLNLQVLLAKGHSNSYFKLEVTKKLFGISAVAIASAFGIHGMAWAIVIGSVFAAGVNASASKRLMGYPLSRQLWDLRDLLLPVVAMVGCVLLLKAALPLAPALQLAVLIAGGSMSYVAVGLILQVKPFIHLVSLVRTVMTRTRDR